MDQCWELCDLNSMYKIPRYGGEKLGEFFYNKHKSLNTLLEGTLFEGRKCVSLNLSSIGSQPELQRPNLMSLPSEILALVLLSVEDEVDRFCLGLSCVKLFVVCEEYWLRHFTSFFLRPSLLCARDDTSWRSLPAKCRIAFATLLHRPSALGGQVPDFSSNVSNLETMQKIGDPYSIIHDFSTLPRGDLEDETPNPLTFVLRQLGKKVWARIIKEESFSSRGPNEDIASILLAYPDASIIRRSLMFPRTTEPVASPLAKKPKVLCNLSKKLFVLEQPMFTVVKRATRSRDMLTLGHIALSQVCCSSERDEGEPTMQRDSVQDSWAGDRLEVVSEDGFLESLELQDAGKWSNRTRWALDVLLDLMEEDIDDILKEQFKPGTTAEDIIMNGVI